MMINETLRLLRTINGVTGKELAANLGISTSYLSEIENGKKIPGLDLLEKYSTAFKVKLSTIILFSEEIQIDKSKSPVKMQKRDMLFRFVKFIENAEASDMDDGESTLSD